jgi:hypothetical protein
MDACHGWLESVSPTVRLEMSRNRRYGWFAHAAPMIPNAAQNRLIWLCGPRECLRRVRVNIGEDAFCCLRYLALFADIGIACGFEEISSTTFCR